MLSCSKRRQKKTKKNENSYQRTYGPAFFLWNQKECLLLIEKWEIFYLNFWDGVTLSYLIQRIKNFLWHMYLGILTPNQICFLSIHNIYGVFPIRKWPKRFGFWTTYYSLRFSRFWLTFLSLSWVLRLVDLSKSTNHRFRKVIEK